MCNFKAILVAHDRRLKGKTNKKGEVEEVELVFAEVTN